jgi:ABC-type multidrug transport system fused ATPase/permease subunit
VKNVRVSLVFNAPCFSLNAHSFVAVADAIHMGTIYLMILLTTMTLISYQATVEPRLGYFAIPSGVLLSVSAWIQVIYSKKVKAAKKEFQKTNDEVFHTLSDSLEGVKILRTANETTWSIDLLTEAFKNSRVSTVANEECTLWLARRADAMGVALSFLTCILCVVLKVAPGPKGLAISNSLQILVFYSWMMKNVAAAIYSSGSVDRIYEYVSSIPQEVRTGDALDRQWPTKGDIEVSGGSCPFCCSLVYSCHEMSMVIVMPIHCSYTDPLATVQRHQPQVRTHSSSCPERRILQAATCCEGRCCRAHRQRQEHAAGGAVSSDSALRWCHCSQRA